MKWIQKCYHEASFSCQKRRKNREKIGPIPAQIYAFRRNDVVGLWGTHKNRTDFIANVLASIMGSATLDTRHVSNRWTTVGILFKINILLNTHQLKLVGSYDGLKVWIRVTDPSLALCAKVIRGVGLKMMLQILLYHLFGHLTNGDAEIAPSPKMSSPIALFEHREFLE